MNFSNLLDYIIDKSYIFSVLKCCFYNTHTPEIKLIKHQNATENKRYTTHTLDYLLFHHNL